MSKTKKSRVRALVLARQGKFIRARDIGLAYIDAYEDRVSRSTVARVLRELCQEGLARWGYGGGRNAKWFVYPEGEQ